MSDIFHEVEEEVRRERFEKIWKQYGDYIIAGFALVIIAIAGYELWQRYETNQRLKASETLIAAQQLAEAGDFARATPALAVVAKDAPGGYAEMARLSQAGVLQAAGRRSEAVQIYKALEARHIPGGLVIYPDEGHGPSKRGNVVNAIGNTIAFFQQHLLGK